MRLLPVLTAALVAGTLAAPVTRAAAPSPCASWTVRVLAANLGSLENVEPDGKDGLFVSATSGVVRYTRAGGVKPVAAAAGVGGLRVRGNTLFFNTGDSVQSGSTGAADGTIQRLDLRTGRRSTFATGLTMPNGLAFLPDGSAVTSRDVAGRNPTGITRVSPGGAIRVRWSDQADSNGLAVDPTGKWLYSDETFTPASNVYRTEIAHPSNRQVVGSLTGHLGLDDLTLSSDNVLYLAVNGSGEVVRLDPRTKQSCVIAAGLHNPSAVKQGRGRSFPAGRLYVTGFDGRLLELTPPNGVTP